jgi:hypothetical protein
MEVNEEGCALLRGKCPVEVWSNHNFKGFKSEERFYRVGGVTTASGKNNHEMRAVIKGSSTP